MTQTVAHILNEAEQLSVAEREELADRLIERLGRDISPEVQSAHVARVRQRIAEVEAGKVSLVPAQEALEQVRRLVSTARARR
ncbi:MAG: addiction module protein [Verrucomicrobiota bacterium]|nr:addiction module protein [Verrucomicrobiota bacterium]